MTTSCKVVWSEGMFLHPHHFQQQDRYIESLILNHLRTLQPYYWGITELKIDEQALLMGKFSLISCKGILSDGTFFNIPFQDKQPLPLSIKTEDTHAIIYLAVPVRQQGLPEISISVDKENTNYRYQAETIEINDSNLGSEIITPIQIGKLKFQFLTSNHDIQGYEYLAIARIEEVHADLKVVLDNEFFPTCLNIHAIPQLYASVEEILGLIHYRGTVLMERLSMHESSGLAEATDYMLLQVMNKYEPFLSHLTTIKNLHPERLYNFFIQLAGELSTFTNVQRRPIQMPQYLHHDLNSVFIPIVKEIRKNLSIVIEENAIALKLEEQQLNTWVATLNDKTLLNTCSFVLSVHAEMPQEELKKLFPAQSKLSPVEQLQHLVIRSLSGIELTVLATAPREIPYHTNYSYFLLSKQNVLWQQLKNSAALAIQVSGQFPGLALKLWAIKDKV